MSRGGKRRAPREERGAGGGASGGVSKEPSAYAGGVATTKHGVLGT